MKTTITTSFRFACAFAALFALTGPGFAETENHWAFTKPQKAERPGLHPHPIDDFLAEAHAAAELRPVATVEKALLLRRVYLDLIGLPPTREQLHAFLDDESTDAYERTVETLLASPQYGERWGQHWMDVWRYTDWYGLGKQLRYSQKHIWHWRDWIIESVNDDKGYDRMIQEMLAGDEIAPTNQATHRATGFLARNYFLFNRTTWLDSTIEHTSKAFLGLTMNCVKCHEHKYDEFPLEDYYRMRAFFEPHEIRLDPVAGETDLEKNGIPRAFDARMEEPTYVHIRGDDRTPDKDRALAPGFPEALQFAALKIQPVSLPPEAHQPFLRRFVRDDQLAKAQAEIKKAEAHLEKAQATLAEIRNLPPPEPVVQAESPSDLYIHDDFSKPNPDLWETGPGTWEHVDGNLVQAPALPERAWLRSKVDHPRNFDATFQFETTGGLKWRSVGFNFDVTDGREKMVYLSAVQPGSKLQLSYKQKGKHAFPAEGRQDRPVPLNQVFRIDIRVREDLINVDVDGKPALAYRFPLPREDGRFEISAFHATAIFHDLTIRSLPAETKLRDAAKSKTAGPATTLEGAEAAVNLARKKLETARLYPTAVTTALDATKSKELTEQANQAAAAHQVAQAEVTILEAKDAKAREKAEKALAAVKEKPTSYKPIRVSRKAKFGPDEKDQERNKPYPETSTGRRTALANWIVHSDNPLAARVAVNHIWTRHFGDPLVSPVTDFGLRTPPPPLQDLLDWLAVEFRESGWSMKQVHRLMVTSDAYRRTTSSRDADPAALAADANNKLFWRRRPVRMEAQMVRDSLIQLGGVLDSTMYGPPFDHQKADTLFRRSVYLAKSRDQKTKFLAMFDDADIVACYRRTESIQPQQALAMSNGRLPLSMAQRIADQYQALAELEFIDTVYETLLAVKPNQAERAACADMLARMRELKKPEGKVRANLVHALFNHNDFLMIR